MAGLIRNLTELRWGRLRTMGEGTRPEQDDRWEVGLALRILGPGEPIAMYHREEHQEDFLILRGEATLIIEGEERQLKQWDFVHCPPGVAHTIVGGPCMLIAVSNRRLEIATGTGWGEYPVEPLAIARGVGVREWTDDPNVAYAHVGDSQRGPYAGQLE